MTDTPKIIALENKDRHEQVIVTPAYRKNVAWETLGGGAHMAASTGLSAAALNVIKQGVEQPPDFSKVLFGPMRETFQFNTPNFAKWVFTGLAIGFAVGAITTSMGAIHHNQALDRANAKWMEKEQARKASPEAGDGVTRS